MPRPRRRPTTLELLETRRLPATITVAPVQVTNPGTATQATFTASLDQSSTTPVTVTYSTANGTARAGRDYTATSSTVTIPAGSTSATFTVPVLAETVAGRSDETFYLHLKASAGNTLASRRVAATIVDGVAKPTVTASDLTVTEPTATNGSRIGYVTIALSNPSAKAVRVSYATVDGTAVSAGTSREFVARSGTAVIRAGATSVRVPVRVYGRATSDETFDFNLKSATNASLSSVLPGGNYGRVVIRDGATTVVRPTVTVSNPTVTAGGVATFDVTLSAASTLPVSFRYSTPATSAYTPVDDVLTIPAGSTTGTISVQTRAAAATTSAQFFVLNLASPANATLASAYATATVTPAASGTGTGTGTTTTPGVTLTGGSVSVGSTGTAVLPFTVTLSAASTSPVTVNYATTDGTAVAGTNYVATSGTLTFAPGVTTQTVDVTVDGQSSTTTPLAFGLTLSGPSNATLTTATATGTINYTSGVTSANGPALTLQGGTVAVGTTGTAVLPFTVTLSAASATAVTVDYTTLDRSAIAGTDYVATTGTLTFAPGVTTQTVNVTVNGETSTASSKTLALELLNPSSNAIVNQNTSTGTITYATATATPAVSVTSPMVNVSATGTTTLTFNIQLSTTSANPVTATYTTADGTALAGTDYVAASGTVTFAAGTDNQTVVVTINGENSTVTAKTFALNVTATTGASNTTATGTGTLNYTVAGTPNVVSSNLTDASDNGVETSTGTTYNAASFTTTAASTLNSVTLLLDSADGGTPTVGIYADDNGIPGALVGTLSAPTAALTSTPAATTFTSANGLALTAGATYWVLLVAPTGSVDWAQTTSDVGTGTGFTDTWAQSSDGGATWFTYNTSPVQMSVTVTPA